MRSSVKGTESTVSRAPGWADLGRRWTDGQTVGEKAFSCEGSVACGMLVGGVRHRKQRPPKPWPRGGKALPPRPGKETPPQGRRDGLTREAAKRGNARRHCSASERRRESRVPRGLGSLGGSGDPGDETETQSPAGLHCGAKEKAQPPGEAEDGAKGAVQAPRP